MSMLDRTRQCFLSIRFLQDCGSRSADARIWPSQKRRGNTAPRGGGCSSHLLIKLERSTPGKRLSPDPQTKNRESRVALQVMRLRDGSVMIVVVSAGQRWRRGRWKSGSELLLGNTGQWMWLTRCPKWSNLFTRSKTACSTKSQVLISPYPPPRRCTRLLKRKTVTPASRVRHHSTLISTGRV